MWTGDEMFIWGGVRRPGSRGAAYDPALDSWRRTAPSPLAARFDPIAVWTGREVVVVGGEYTWGRSSEEWVTYADGAAYDPADDTWRSIATFPLSPREASVAVWTGTELIVWGGLSRDRARDTFEVFADGAAYDPERDLWRVLASSPLEARAQPVAVWTGNEVIVWGGIANTDPPDPDFPLNAEFVDGARYSPATDSWSSIVDAPAAMTSPDYGFSVVWTDDEMLVWNGSAGDSSTASYDPDSDEWRLRAGPPLREVRGGQATVWTGTHLVVWGGGIGEGGNHAWGDGATYEPATDTWELLPPAPLLPRFDHSGVWTGEEVLLWGGLAEDHESDDNPQFVAGDGAAWRPAS